MSWLERLFPRRDIGRDGEYLERYYVFGRAPLQYWPMPVRPRMAWLPFAVYIHRFARPDEDRELHNHPWSWAVSIILRGGYVEERRTPDDTVKVRTLRPGFLNFIWDRTFHRVLRLRGPSVWTLFIAGPKVDSWGFWDRDTGAYEHWRDHMARKQRAAIHDRVIHIHEAAYRRAKEGRDASG